MFFVGLNVLVGKNGCIYFKDIFILFNQFDVVGVMWKGYVQDLCNYLGCEDGLVGLLGIFVNIFDKNFKVMKMNVQDEVRGIILYIGVQVDD